MKKTLSIFGVMVVVAIFSNKLSAQECVTCDDTRQSVSIGFDNNLNLKHYAYLFGENINCISDNAIVIGRGYFHDANNYYPLHIKDDGIFFGVGSTIPTVHITATASNSTGLMSIGSVATPAAKLHIRADKLLDSGIFLELWDKESGHRAFVKLMDDNHIIQASKLHGMMIKAVNDSMNFVANSFNFRGGKIGINCKNDLDDYAVAVNGGLICTRVTVRVYDNWPDFVFAPGHTMMSLAEIEKYVNENRHLPGIPSSEEMSEKGLDVAEMDAALLQKIEELTLYIIEQQKQIDELKQCLNSVVKGDSSQDKQ